MVGSGVAWAVGGTLDAAGFNLLNWHIALGFTLVAAVSAHMVARAKPLRRRDLAGRRQALRWLALAGVGVAAWPVRRGWGDVQRFTGSRPLGRGADGTPDTNWPPTSWVADAPRPLDPATWHLAVTGHVATPLTLRYDALCSGRAMAHTTARSRRFSTARAAFTRRKSGAACAWAICSTARGCDRARAGCVSSRVTGYRWSLPLAEARDALLATHTLVRGEAVPLSHGHGGPARLVAPGRRGFQWVKWVVAVDVLTAPDPAQALAIHTSSFTPAGRGDIAVQ